jgi:transposase
MRYKKYSSPNKVLVLEPITFNKTGNGLKKKGFQNLNPSKDIKTTKNVRLCYSSVSGKYILHIPYDKEMKTSLIRKTVCSLDPGIRTFQTLYSPDKSVIEIGDVNSVIDKNIKAISNSRKNKRKRKYRKKLQNNIKNMHWKVCKYICTKFKKIQIGNMSTKSIVKKGECLNKSVKTKTYALSHYMFKLRLQSKCEEYDG